MTRRIIYTLIIVGAAVGLAWWGSRRESQRYDAIRSRVTLLCESLADGRDITWQYDWASPSVARPVMERIREIAMSIPDETSRALRVEVAPEGLAPFDRGSATHQALLYVYDESRLGLLLEAGERPEDVVIVGYWEPTQQ